MPRFHPLDCLPYSTFLTQFPSLKFKHRVRDGIQKYDSLMMISKARANVPLQVHSIYLDIKLNWDEYDNNVLKKLQA